eukprot:scaffold587_cov171-Amphora_coffeaeformis.AAC.4
MAAHEFEQNVPIKPIKWFAFVLFLDFQLMGQGGIVLHFQRKLAPSHGQGHGVGRIDIKGDTIIPQCRIGRTAIGILSPHV